MAAPPHRRCTSSTPHYLPDRSRADARDPQQACPPTRSCGRLCLAAGALPAPQRAPGTPRQASSSRAHRRQHRRRPARSADDAAAAAGWVRVERRPGGYALVVLAREPVNTMNLAFWLRLQAVLEELEADPQVRGAIFCSGLRRDVFTAGNDIGELYAPATSRQRYREFWGVSNRFLARLYTSPLVTVAAIRGACPAGGCCLAMCCDHRVMTSTGSIGLNEVALGISVPKMWAGLMARLVGAGPAEKLLQFAVMLSPADALAAGLIDDVSPKEGLLAAAEEAMAQMLRSPDGSRAETKRLLRGQFAADWVAYATGEADYAWDLLSSPEVVAQLAAVRARLSGGGGGAKKQSKL